LPAEPRPLNRHWIVPEWPAPARVRSLITTRHGGVSRAPYASLNLGDHVGDDPLAVASNRRRLEESLPAPPCWLQQVHGTTIIDAAARRPGEIVVADGAFSHASGVVCAVMTADCLPVLLCDRAGQIVAAAHAGWRGLQAGILEQTVAAMGVAGEQLIAYLGPAIGAGAFAVGDDVLRLFVDADPAAAAAFKPAPENGQARLRASRDASPVSRELPEGGWLADIYLLARQRLGLLGVEAVYGGGYCTVSQAASFFSYRRDRVTGRMASLIWLAKA
jgi:YfiH family protein